MFTFGELYNSRVLNRRHGIRFLADYESGHRKAVIGIAVIFSHHFNMLTANNRQGVLVITGPDYGIDMNGLALR